MKKILIPVSVMFVAVFYHGQSLTTTENYVYSKTYLDYNGTTPTKVSESVQYLDGLGRVKQVVNVKSSPLGKDIVTHVEYDVFGRQVKDYLPIPQSSTGNGAIVINPLGNASNTPYGAEKIYAEKTLENSPLDRILEQRQVGNAWNSKPVKFDYDANSDGEVKKYIATFNYNNFSSSLELSPSSYTVGQLYKNTVTDEDGNKTIEFKNSEGQVLLVRKMLDTSNSADTYYVYNQYNQLAFVIPPLASSSPLSPTILENLCYQYKYDSRNRLVEKKLPGKGWEFMVYDKADRLIMNQDANLRPDKRWLFTKYDKFGRVLYTGITDDPNGRAIIQGFVDDNFPYNYESSGSFAKNGLTTEYTNSNAFPTNIYQLLSVNYYDSYPNGTPGFTPTLPGNTVITDDFTQNVNTKSLPTASFVKNIEDDNWTKNYLWYDERGRTVATYSINHLGGYTKTESELDFSGLVKKSVTRHKRLDSDSEKVITENFTYDHQNRLLSHTHQVDNNPVEYLSKNSYNELSQLQSKKVGGTDSTPLQIVDYTYNIRGWLTSINDPNNLGNDLFGYKIKYNHVEGLQTPDASDTSLKVVPKFNGNIAEIDWKTSTQENEPLKTYGYVYDGLNRLSAGFYQNSSNPSRREYYEKVTYDLNGNIKTLKRTGASLGAVERVIDNLTYDYYPANASNRLQKITDASQNITGYPYNANPTDIGYDVNGNMTSFQDKDISSIQYNYLNLPQQITQNSVVTNYTYRADGVKVKKLFGSVETHYLDGFQYKYTEPWEDMNGTMLNAEMKLRTIPTSEGYFDSLLNLYVYNYVDHLGNVRVSYADSDHDGSIRGKDQRVTECHNGYCLDYFIPGEVVENNAYYPFGMLLENHNYYANNSNAYKYKYNGKELQETGMYAMDFRHYMPDIGRFAVQDALGMITPDWTPYRFAFNNPVYFKDPTGLFEEGGNALATCPTCPNTKEFQPFINDPNNVYVYNPETNTAEKEIQIQEVTITGKKSESNTLDYFNFVNDRIGDAGSILEHRPNQGGSIAFWTTPVRNRTFDGINYSRVNVRYYRNNWSGNGFTGPTSSISKYLSKGSVIASVTLGAIEVGNGIAEDYNDYQTKGETNGKNTAVSSAKVVTGAAAGWAAGAATGALIGSSFPVVGTIVGAAVGAVVGYYASEAAGELVEKAYE